eukprot:CAMPEP_0118934994 /NCGR_PEP_ID=MMETSP1169-20130426/14677_1 /TAXON_ID=36882 /ORGANISM="Pyramimonas obovata, Strain CCMP722" /LENGTH=259 /DNA_ID=CAMNT_0006877971 /DNA_START=166 /DNA_END=945 /DNA_ORIENTATION=+
MLHSLQALSLGLRPSAAGFRVRSSTPASAPTGISKTALTSSPPVVQGTTIASRRSSDRSSLEMACGASEVEEASTVQSGPTKPCPTWRDLEGAIEDAESNPDMAIRVAAAKTLTRETSWEVIDEPSTLEACAGILGDLGQAQKICDEHVRLVVDCLLNGTAKSTETFYDAFKKLPPFYRREQEIVCVAVGSSTLQFVRDEQDIIASVLGEGATDEDGKRMAAMAAAICDAIDMISDVMPDTVADEETLTSVPMSDPAMF